VPVPLHLLVGRRATFALKPVARPDVARRPRRASERIVLSHRRPRRSQEDRRPLLQGHGGEPAPLHRAGGLPGPARGSVCQRHGEALAAGACRSRAVGAIRARRTIGNMEYILEP
jgi:hypothetical protein